MSVTHSVSTDSTSSSTQPNEQQMDPSNILYNDHQNYHTIFTNDSRFFDTSLYLFKSYCDLGYIQLDDKKSNRNIISTSTNTLKPPQSNGHHNRWRSKPNGFSSNHDVNGYNNGTLKPPFSRNNDHSISQRSDPGSSNVITSEIKRDNSHLVGSHQRQRTPANHSTSNSDTSDDPDIIVTRL